VIKKIHRKGIAADPLRGLFTATIGATLEEIRADILALEKETEGLLGEIIGGA
jgi:hypothetical protein